MVEERALGSKERELGSEERALGSEERALGSEEHTLWSEEHVLGSEERTLGSEERRVVLQDCALPVGLEECCMLVSKGSAQYRSGPHYLSSPLVRPQLVAEVLVIHQSVLGCQ